jgi:uncharacterized Fe-S cluster protein YjdI/CDGSH-type Zn-finger protein
MMEKKLRRYTGKEINVTFDVQRCIHAEECVHGAPEVFDQNRRPWILPDNSASADELAEVVMRCPTGAIHFEYESGDPVELPDDTNTLIIAEDGPLYVRGDLLIQSNVGEFSLKETRAAFCRCGHSENKPFCDNSHLAEWFEASSTIDDESKIKIVPVDKGPLEITYKADRVGSLIIKGPLQILDENGEVIYRNKVSSMCTCGLSQKKPFCDSSHKI